MGVAVIFGLTVATVLTLVVVPVTYDSLDGLSEALADWRAKRQRGVEPVEERSPQPSGYLARSAGVHTGIARTAGETPIANRDEARGRLGTPTSRSAQRPAGPRRRRP